MPEQQLNKLKASAEKRKRVLQKLIEAVENIVIDKLSPKLEFEYHDEKNNQQVLATK